MIQITPQMRVLVAVEAVDFRKGIDSLAQLCRDKLSADPFSGCDYLNQNVAFQEIHTLGRLNEFRFGYHRGYRTATNPRKGTDFKATDIGINGLKQGGPDGRELTRTEAGFPTISISGFLGLGESGGSDYDFTRTFQFVDNFSIFHGNHALKMGVDIRRAMGDANTINWPYGQIEFTN